MTERPTGGRAYSTSSLGPSSATGETTTRTVTATHVMLHDGDLLDLTIKDGDGDGVIQTTDDHPFSSVTDGDWEPATDLSVGEQLCQSDGSTATVVKSLNAPVVKTCTTSPSTSTTTSTSTLATAPSPSTTRTPLARAAGPDP